MEKDLLVILLEQRMKERSLSIREAAKEIGVSHTTISRIINEQTTADIYTLIAVSKWLGCTPSSLLNGEVGGKDALVPKIAALVEAYPDLAAVLEKALERVEKEEISPDVLVDLMRYAAYRLG